MYPYTSQYPQTYPQAAPYIGPRSAPGSAVFTLVCSIVVFALVLLLSSPGKRRAALTQMAPGLLAVLALAIGLVAS